MTVILDKATATGGAALGTFAYDPSTDSMYVTSFGAGGEMRKVVNVDGAGAGQAVQSLVSQAQWTLFTRDGDPNRSGGQPVAAGLLLNPEPVGAIPAYGAAWVMDGGGVVRDGTTVRNDLTQRLYRYNLQAVPTGQDGRAVFTSLLTKAESAAAAAGLASNVSTSDNVGRQFAWSRTGQSVYFVDTSAATAFGGLWKMDAATGGVARLHTDGDLASEPAVIPAAPGGAGERVLVNGTAASGNAGGVDAISHDGAATGSPTPFVTAAELRDFLELPAGSSADVRAVASSAGGDVYLYDIAKRVLLRRDAAGRLAKVASKAERDAFHGATTNSNILRMQPRTVTYAGPSATFAVTQILYAESSPISLVGGIYDFKTGDFNRDNAIDGADVSLFKPLLTTRGTPVAAADNLKFDLNGNGAVDWKDVKVLQQFYPFDDGDADISRRVDYADLDAIEPHYLGTDKVWTGGDFTGDNAVGFGDLEIVAANWDLSQPTSQDFDAHGYTGQYRTDLERAFNVPEPASAGALLAAAALGLLHRRAVRRGARRDGAFVKD